MICDSYKKLDSFEGPLFIAKLIHAIQNSSHCFNIGQSMIDTATAQGLFEKVKFSHEIKHEDNEIRNH